MLRFGLHMALRSGREALVRLLVTALSVGIGVGLLLSVLAMYHAYQGAVATPCWQCTQATSANGPLLWDYDQDTYDGRTIDRVDVATLAPGGPVLPGLSAMPATGQYYASPALATLLRSVPANQLGDRFPGTLAGTIGRSGLQSPGELAIVVGRTPSALKALPDTVRISAIDTAPRGLSTSQFYQFGFALGAVALLVPMLVLIGTATRMAAARREERYAAMRLVGAERGQINVVASVDAVVGAVLGAGVGIGIYAVLRPLLAHIPLLGYRFFGDMVTPPGWGYVVALVAVPLAATLACLASLRRVRISPLGVTRKVTPKPPRIWRILPLLIGLGMFIIPLLTQPTASRGTPGLAVLALILVMVGLMVAGPWLTMTASRLLARWSRGGSGLLAARRLADNPRASFRAVSGLVLAVMVGTALAALVPAALASQDTTADSGLNNVLRFGTTEIKPADPNEPPGDGLDPAQAAP
ncbi:MAG TPA: FtsX-like permease family protein, partial [Micromonosporaceae bacterium]